MLVTENLATTNMKLAMMKKTKIVATIGPATENEDTMMELVKSGLNVVRLNFSHGTWDEHQNRFNLGRAASKKLNVPVAILQDLSGPKIRIGEIAGEKLELKAGSSFTLTIKPCMGNSEKAYVNYDKLAKEVKVGGNILLRDGRVKLKVESIKGDDINCLVVSGGEIKSRAGVNVPGAYLSIPCLTEKDRKDLEFGLKNDVDIIALSFVRKGSDVKELKDIIAKSKKNIHVMAKIETQEAIENIDDIINESHSIMVARGDLASEFPPEEVPILQKMIVKKCNKAGKSVIVATQMLESMINSSVPTRAEVNDIANAILDGADAVMLSEETTLGKNPVEAVKMMTRVAQHTEKHYPHEEILKREHLVSKDTTDSVCYSAVSMAHETDAKAIVALTVSGFTGRMIARYKPKQPLIVITPAEKTYNRLALKFNCYPVLTEMFSDVSSTIERSKKIVKENGLVLEGGKVVIVAGVPFSEPGNTNLVLVQKV